MTEEDLKKLEAFWRPNKAGPFGVLAAEIRRCWAEIEVLTNWKAGAKIGEGYARREIASWKERAEKAEAEVEKLKMRNIKLEKAYINR